MEVPATPGDSACRLSAVDAGFLYLERKEIPLHMAIVAIFDGPIPFDLFAAQIESKLPLIPRYRQVVHASPYNLGHPTWEEDPHFDIRRHIFRVNVDPPGGQAELEALAGRILTPLMDRSKPLWDFYIVDGLKDGRGALIARMHHALADGILGTELLRLLLAATPEGSVALRKPRARRRKTPASSPSIVDAVVTVVEGSLQGLMAAEQGLLNLAESLLGDGQDDLKGLVDLLPEFARSVERLPFNKPCGGERKFCCAELDLADVQAIRQAAGGTVNDVILTLLTRALARYTKLHKESVVNRFVRIVCPVNLRRGQQGTAGNELSFLPVALPMDVGDPVRMLQAVSARTEAMKRGKAADMVALAASCIAAVPPALQELFWKGISQITLPLPLFNIICTNVGGLSPVPLYAAGRRMIASYPQVPTGYELGIGCAVQSYAGKLLFGLIADEQVAPDVNRLRDFLYVSFRELYRAAHIKKPRQVRPRRTKSKSAGPDQMKPSEPVEQVPSESAPVALVNVA